MSRTVHLLSPSGVNERTIDLCAEALTSSDPPLTACTQGQIAAVELVRTIGLDGPDHFHALNLFEILRKAPPIGGPTVKKVLTLLAATDFSSDALKSCVQQAHDTTKDGPERHATDEFGFASETMRFGDCESKVIVRVDRQGARERTADALRELWLVLRAVKDPATRLLLIKDACEIVDLRLSFDLS